MRKITRAEMWEAITKKYKSLLIFRIDCRYGEWSRYIRRKFLFDIIIEMKIHKSRHLNKEQKKRIEYELNLKALEKI